jgi:hypothetical protein
MNATDSEITATLERLCRRERPSRSVIELMGRMVGSTGRGLKTLTRLKEFFFVHHFSILETSCQMIHPFDESGRFVESSPFCKKVSVIVSRRKTHESN